MPAIDDKQRDAVDWITRHVAEMKPNQDALWHLAGAPGSGKSTVLRLLVEPLRSKKLIPLLISAPAGDADAGPIALLEMADQMKLADKRLLNGEAKKLSNPTVPWSDKLKAIVEVVKKHHKKFVILCDEPSRWFHQHESVDDDISDSSARELAKWLMENATCRRMVSGWIPKHINPLGVSDAPLLDDGSTLLDQGPFWGDLRLVASQLSQLLPQPLPSRSVWEVKLLVALSRLSSPSEVAESAITEATADALMDEVMNLLEKEPSNGALRESLVRLSVPRTPLPLQRFDALLGNVPSVDRDFIRICLSETDGDRLALHSLVRHEVISRATSFRRPDVSALWRMPGERERAHQELRDEYSIANSANLRDGLESLHHEVLAGSFDLTETDPRISFPQQLHEIGRTLSYVYQEHQSAAQVFQLALKLYKDDAYSHHYLAFNLDWLAERPKEVESHYKRAIELRKTHPWWWSRWISYLATGGRIKEAKSEWRRAIHSMSISEDCSPPWVFQYLHRWVAQWLLHWGELDFADEVLRSIPSYIVEDDTHIQALKGRLAALREAERGNAVFPLTIEPKEWWTNPHTNVPRIWHGQWLTDWMQARVDAVDVNSGRVSLTAAKRPKTGPTVYCNIELTKDQIETKAFCFEWDDLVEGRHVELAFYGGSDELRYIGLHRAADWKDPLVTSLVPPPDRWFDAAVESVWQSNGGDAE